MIRRHVLRNALLPTITVVASLLGYLAGGLVVIETLFHYRGIGALIYSAARAKDFPDARGGRAHGGLVYALASVLADLSERGSQSAPASRARMSAAAVLARPRSRPARTLARERWRAGAAPHPHRGSCSS